MVCRYVISNYYISPNASMKNYLDVDLSTSFKYINNLVIYLFLWAVKKFLPKLIYFFLLIFIIHKLVNLLLLTLDVWCVYVFMCLLCEQSSYLISELLCCSQTLLLGWYNRSSYFFRFAIRFLYLTVYFFIIYDQYVYFKLNY